MSNRSFCNQRFTLHLKQTAIPYLLHKLYYCRYCGYFRFNWNCWGFISAN